MDACSLRAHGEVPATAGSGSRTSASSPPMIAWRAPGTPNSYGPPTTRGISSKLKIGGGEDTCHSIVFARHGFAAARGPYRQETYMLYMNTSWAKPRMKD